MVSIALKEMPEGGLSDSEIKKNKDEYQRARKWASDFYKRQYQRPRRRKYNQASYLSGLNKNKHSIHTPPNIRRNKGIYKPYANGGGVRKPKYNKKG